MNLPNSQSPSRYQHRTFVLKAFKNSQLIKYPKLTELYFNPTSHLSLDPRSFTKFCQGLKTLKSLRVLYLNFSCTRTLSDKSLRELSLALRRLHSLTILSLNFKQNHLISGKGIAKLLKTVKNNRFLTELYLDFSECSEASEPQLESIYDSISSMKLLKSLHLHHFQVPLYFTTGAQLSNNLVKLRRLHYLKDFSMNFTKLWNGLKNHEIIALSKSIRGMVRLSKVSLDSIGSQTFSKESLESLANSLKSLPKLQKLHLHFSDYTTDQNCFNIISQAFENSPTLSHLILDFSRASLTSLAAKKLLLSLKTLTNLSRLDIDFSYCRDAFWGENISSITNLSLGLLYITFALENLTSLKIFELTFPNQSLKKVFLRFTKALSRLTNLSRLLLNFAHSQDLENQDVKALASSLQNFKNLEHLELNLSSALQMTDEGFHDLASQIASLKCLKMLSLNFYGCQKITSEGVQYFKLQIAQLESLKIVYLNFPSTASSYSGFAQPSKKSTCSIF